jgi:hypothetical protein
MTAISAASATESDSRETANPFPDLPAFRVPEESLQLARPGVPATRRFPSPRFGDYSRTRFESRVALGGPDGGEDAEDVAPPPDGSRCWKRQVGYLMIPARPTKSKRSGGSATRAGA